MKDHIFLRIKNLTYEQQKKLCERSLTRNVLRIKNCYVDHQTKNFKDIANVYISKKIKASISKFTREFLKKYIIINFSFKRSIEPFILDKECLI